MVLRILNSPLLWYVPHGSYQKREWEDCSGRIHATRFYYGVGRTTVRVGGLGGDGGLGEDGFSFFQLSGGNSGLAILVVLTFLVLTMVVFEFSKSL